MAKTRDHKLKAVVTKPTPPPGYRPMDELTAEGREVDMVLPTGEVVRGWLFCGNPSAPRTFWMQGTRGSQCIEPIGWTA